MSHAIKYFGLNNIALEHDLRKVARDKKLQIRPSKTKSNRDAYYPQITERIRYDAAAMAEHYELFYCLEISIRDLIRSTLEEKESDWWDKLVPKCVRDNANKSKSQRVRPA